MRRAEKDLHRPASEERLELVHDSRDIHFLARTEARFKVRLRFVRDSLQVVRADVVEKEEARNLHQTCRNVTLKQRPQCPRKYLAALNSIGPALRLFIRIESLQDAEDHIDLAVRLDAGQRFEDVEARQVVRLREIDEDEVTRLAVEREGREPREEMTVRVEHNYAASTRP